MSDPITMLEDQLFAVHRRYESSEGLLQQLIRENEILREGLEDIADGWLEPRDAVNDILERANEC